MINLSGRPNRGSSVAPVLRWPPLSGALSLLRKVTTGREVWALADQAMVSGTNFLTNVVLARMAGIEVFGTFTLAWMVVLFASLFQNALIISPMMSLRPKIDKGTEAEYIGSLLLHEVIFACVAAAIVQIVCHVLAVHSHRQELLQVGPALAVATFCYLAQDFMRRYFFVIRRSATAFWTDLLSYPPQLVLIASVARWHGIRTGSALWIVAGTSAVGLVVALSRVGTVRLREGAVRKIARESWMLSRWLVLSVVLDWIPNNVFFLAATVYLGAAAAGALRAPQNLVGIAHIWYLGLGNVMAAEASHALHRGGVHAATHYIRKVTLRWGTITAAFVLVVVACPRLILHLAYGPHFEAYGSLLRLYGLLYMLVFFGYPVRALLNALESTSLMFWTSLVGATFVLCFAIPLVKTFGLTGTVCGSIACQVIVLATQTVALKRRLSSYGRHSIPTAGLSTATSSEG